MTTPTPEPAESWDLAERAAYEAEWLQQFRTLTPMRETARLANSEDSAERERGLDRLVRLAALARVGGAL